MVDLWNYPTDNLSRKVVIKWLLNILSHPKRVLILTGKSLLSENQ